MKVQPIGQARATPAAQIARSEAAKAATASQRRGDEVRAERTRQAIDSETRNSLTSRGSKLDVLA